jgi:hypothetical protein
MAVADIKTGVSFERIVREPEHMTFEGEACLKFLRGNTLGLFRIE